MSKLQLLYEKLMKIMYIFAGLFFVLFLVDLFVAISTNAFDCTSVTLCVIRDSSSFIKFSLYPVAGATIAFIVAGRIFFGLAHKESDLMSVSDYRRSIESADSDGQGISRDEISERFRQKEIQKSDNIFNKFGKQIQKLVTGMKENSESRAQRKRENKEAKEKIKLAHKNEQLQLQKIENDIIHEEDAKKARKKLNKTELILYVADVAKLSQNDARKFINTFTDIIKETVTNNEEVKIAKFGKFSKEIVEESIETNPITKEETTIEAHNTVEFLAFKAFLNTLNGVVIEKEEIIIEEPVQEVVKEEVKEEVVESKEEVVEDFDDLSAIPDSTGDEDEEYLDDIVEEEPVQVEEEPVQVEEEPVQVEEEPVQVEEEPVQVEEEPVQVEEEPVQVEEEPIQVEEEPSIVVVPVINQNPELQNIPDEKEELKVESGIVKTVDAAKPKKVKVKSRTKTDFINMMDAETNLSKNKANKFLKYFAEVVKEQLVNGEDVDLEGIGYFTTIEMPAKEAVNPQTKQKIIVPSHHQVRLRFKDDLKGRMNPKN